MSTTEQLVAAAKRLEYLPQWSGVQNTIAIDGFDYEWLLKFRDHCLTILDQQRGATVSDDIKAALKRLSEYEKSGLHAVYGLDWDKAQSAYLVDLRRIVWAYRQTLGDVP